MINIWNLIVVGHRRKKHIFGLIVIVFVITCCIPLFNSISLGQGMVINTAFQHIVIEIIGLLFLLYFGSLLLKQFQDNKTLQLLRSKKKQPLAFIIGSWLGIFSIYTLFVIIAGSINSLYYGDIHIFLSYINLLISGAIALSFVFFFSILTNSYTAMLATLVVYVISYSINFIIFSTPTNFEGNISFKILTIVQYLFPRFDILYSTQGYSRGRAIGGNFLYFVCISIIMIFVFLSHFAKK